MLFFQYCCIHIKTYYNQIDVINNIVLPYRIVDMTHDSYVKLQIIFFALVSASFTNIYITQPVLPVLQNEFSADMVRVSFSVSTVILGIAASNLLFGFWLYHWL